MAPSNVALKCFTRGQLHSLVGGKTVLILKETDLKLCKLNTVWSVLFLIFLYFLCHGVESRELMRVALLVASS